MKFTYTEAMERSPMDGGDDSTGGCLFSAPLHLPLFCVNQHKVLVTSKGYCVVITASIPVDRLIR